MQPYPEDSDRKQGLTKAAEMAVSCVPAAGSALQVAFNELAGRRLAERRSRRLNDLATKVHPLDGRIGDFDTKQLFFDMIDRFTPTHVRLLHLLADPPGWFKRHNIPQPTSTMGSKSTVIKAGMPELAGRDDLITRYGAALANEEAPVAALFPFRGDLGGSAGWPRTSRVRCALPAFC